MKKVTMMLLTAATLLGATCMTAMATPSTQIWIPSTDIQAFGTVHLGIDNYFRSTHHSQFNPDYPYRGRDNNVLDIGLTVGVLPFEKLQMEVGVDYLVIAGDPNDNHPWSANFKIGMPEDAMFKYSPAIAAGMYNVGSQQKMDISPLVISGQNIVYALAAKTIPAMGPVPSLGRISAGYYHGSRKTLVDKRLDPAKSQNEGLLLSWDRTMSEISDKLWMAVDYMSGNNVQGALSFGVSWAFSKNVSLIVGYNVYKEKSLAGSNTITTQLDINIP